MPSPKCAHAPQRTQCRICSPDGWIANKWYTHKQNAKRRGIANELTREQYIAIAKRDCTYCHAPLAGGVDRVDNNGHYSVANSAPCCKHCNTAKGSRTVEEFLNYAKRITGEDPNGFTEVNVLAYAPESQMVAAGAQ